MQEIIEATSRPMVRVIFERAGMNWSAYAPAVPGVLATGDTAEETRQNLEAALSVYLDETHKDECAAPGISAAR